MAIDENLFLTEIVNINREMSRENQKLAISLAQISAKIDGFLHAQNGMQTEINGLKSDITAVRRDVSEIKQESLKSKSFIGGVLAAWSAAWTGFLLFGWPYLKSKLGL